MKNISGCNDYCTIPPNFYPQIEELNLVDNCLNQILITFKRILMERVEKLRISPFQYRDF